MKFNFYSTNNKFYWNKIKKLYPKGKLCFIHTPKCGGTFASQIFRDLKIRYKKQHNLANKNDGITFTIIRHPVHRFESLINYRLNELKPRRDWPNHLKYVYKNKSINLNQIIKKMSNKEILNFKPFNSLIYYSKNIKIFITIDNLYNFLSFFGYNYDPSKYKKKNVSKKKRGKFNYNTKKRIFKLYFLDAMFFKYLTQ